MSAQNAVSAAAEAGCSTVGDMKSPCKMEPGTTLFVSDLVTRLLMFMTAMSFLAVLIVVGVIFQMLGGSIDSAFVDWFAIKLSGG